MAAGQMYVYNAYGDADEIISGDSFLYEINGYNDSADDLWIFISNSVGPPTGFAFVVNVLAVPAGAEFSWAPSSPLQFDLATRWDISSTGSGFTASAESFYVFARGREQ